MPVDESKIATWAARSPWRVLVSPVLFALIPSNKGGSWIAFALWFVLCSTDFIDGYLARRRLSTRSGAFLDPSPTRCWCSAPCSPS
ncbi:MAG: CDP-alcohol phosphatidyltransferase family protein [Ilumatobacteraceae bacterium]